MAYAVEMNTYFQRLQPTGFVKLRQRQMEGEKGRVCVTGGSGFIGSWLIMRLLEHGYSVNTTVRSDPEHKKDVSFLTALPGAEERLQIFNADLSNPESFNAAIQGCIGVFHVATPVDFQDKEPEPVMTKRSVEGALSILNACLHAKTVKRVVYTSSASAVAFANNDVEDMDESFWSDTDYIKALKPFGGSYMISKTLTERAVLEFSENYGLDVVTVIPSFVVGPFICPKLPGSVKTSLALVLDNSKDEFPIHNNMTVVHVDDVARAHIFLFEHPDAKGRYNCSSNVITIEEMAEFLSANFPEFQISSSELLKEFKGPKSHGLSSKKLLDSGFEFKYGVDEMFRDAVLCCKEKGYL